MTAHKVTQICDVCGSSYQHGPHRYEGHKLSTYGIVVCDSCWTGNHDGWAPFREPKLVEALKRNRLPMPQRNSKGLLPRD